jgi:hypothetical protein
MALAAKDLFSKDGKSIQQEVDKDNGEALQGNWTANQSTAQVSVERNQAASDKAKQDELDGGGGEAIKMVNDRLTALKGEFPVLAAAIEAGAVAMGVLTAAIGASTVAVVFTGGGKGLGVWRVKAAKRLAG